MAKVTVRIVGSISVDEEAAGRALADAILKLWAKRTAAGKDVDDRPFRRYSPLYARQLAAIGESTTPDVSRTGAMLKSLHLKKLMKRRGAVTVHLGASGSSTSTPRPPPWVFDPSKTPAQQAAALERWRRSPKRAKRVSNSKKLRWLERAHKQRQRRGILGVSARARASILRAIEHARIFKR